MGYLKHVLRLSRRCDDLEDRLLKLEYRRLLSEDFSDDYKETEIRSMLDETSTELRGLSTGSAYARTTS